MTTLTGRLADLASGALLGTAQITGVSRLSAGFVRVKLTAEAFQKAAWAPGVKLQLRPQRGRMALRTYTPVDWDATRGAVDLIGFTHAGGPGAEWFRRAAVGDACQVFGPRRSIALRDLAGAVLFVGDESSVALACALQSVTSNASYVFEARDPAGLSQLLAGLGIAERVAVVTKAADRTDLLRQAREVAAVGPCALVVTGDAATVHAVRRDSRNWAPAPVQVKGKAYWAEGRAGLD
ncbi:siderophore-interacting protein [Micromonospora sp. NPDC051925]|uniref:siderophore-interacting protein n=1 Tax=Micromonospora sp. NPDC051925 TaxID=3364288 RepID=UPI0037C97F41